MIHIHPFDMYVFLRDHPDITVRERGMIMLPAYHADNPLPYARKLPTVKIGMDTYVENSAVPAVTKELE